MAHETRLEAESSIHVATHLSDGAYLTPCGGRTREVRQSTVTTRVLSVSPFGSTRE
jgi:hypothetical protein